MKKTTILSVMALLWPIANKDQRSGIKDIGAKLKACLLIILLSFLMGQLQAQENKAIDVTLKGLQIGQQVPDITITNLHNYKDAHGKPATTAKISDFKGKLLILDFWATWCSPCIAMIPKMDSLQKQFANQIQFLSVSYQSKKEVLPFLEKLEQQKKRHFDLPVVTDDKELHKLFPHVSLPHYVWIGGDGRVAAITGYQQVNVKGIETVLSAGSILQRKHDLKIAFDYTKPLLVNGNGGDGSKLVYHSLLTSYQPGLHSGYEYKGMRKGDIQAKITVKNYTYPLLFALAYGGDKQFFGKNRTLIKVKDSSGLAYNGKGDLQLWRDANQFCYELILPEKFGQDAFQVMRKDMEMLFSNYTARVEKRMVLCWALQLISGTAQIASKGGTPQIALEPFGFKVRNISIDVLLAQLGLKYQQKSAYPLVNQTNFKGRIDLTINADLSNIQLINEALKPFNLVFVKQHVSTDMLIIEDIS